MINQNELWILIIGGSISLISTIVGYTIQLISQNYINQRGKIKLYKKLVYSKIDQLPWGSRSKVFSVPLWIEFHNTKNQNEVIRNINLILYKNNKEIGKMTQITHFTKEDQVQKFANNGSYSLILNPTSIEKYDLHFTIKKEDCNSSFDEIRLRYYNTKDKKQEFQLLKLSNPWSLSNNETDSDWELIELI